MPTRLDGLEGQGSSLPRAGGQPSLAWARDGWLAAGSGQTYAASTAGIHLESDVSVTIASGGKVLASSRPFPSVSSDFTNAPGSGGAIRLVAPRVLGDGTLQVKGGSRTSHCGALIGGDGRIRIDTLDRPSLALVSNPAAVIGSLMLAIPSVQPRLDIVHCAGEDIALDAGPVVVILPEIASATQTVSIRATGFSGVVPIRLRLVPEAGTATTQDLEIDMGLGDPAEIDVDVTFPANVRTRVEVFTR